MNFFKAILVIFAAALVLAFFYFLTLLGPGEKVEYDYVYIDPERESKDILKESEMLEDEFEKASLAAKVTEADIEKLRRAIALQEVYIDKARLIDRAPAERLLKLQTRLDDTEATPLAEIIAELEKKALAAETEEKDSEAVEIYKQLYDLQSRINTDYPHSKYKDIRNKMFLARPMYLKSVEAENAAREALEKGDWATAQLQFEKAIETITQMNSTYPTSVYTDFARLQKLDIELDSLKSSSLAAKINDYLEKAAQCYKKALKRKKDSYKILYNYALTNHLLGNYKEAGLSYCKAIEVEPLAFDAHYNLALLLRKLKRPKEAQEELEKALLIVNTEQNPHIARYIFDVYAESVEKSTAQREYQMSQRATAPETQVKEGMRTPHIVSDEIENEDDPLGVTHITYVNGKVVTDSEEADEHMKKTFSKCTSKKLFEDFEEEDLLFNGRYDRSF